MKKEKNAFIKILIVLVIASLDLLAIVYFMTRDYNNPKNSWAWPIVSLGAKCGNGKLEPGEMCDGEKYSEHYIGMCDPNKYINRCGHNCQAECILKAEYVEGEGLEYCESKFPLTEVQDLIIDSKCSEAGTLDFENIICNENSNNWWIDIINSDKEGCMLACVVNVEDQVFDINWRCTGLDL